MGVPPSEWGSLLQSGGYLPQSGGPSFRVGDISFRAGVPPSEWGSVLLGMARSAVGLLACIRMYLPSRLPAGFHKETSSLTPRTASHRPPPDKTKPSFPPGWQRPTQEIESQGCPKNSTGLGSCPDNCLLFRRSPISVNDILIIYIHIVVSVVSHVLQRMFPVFQAH